MDSWKIELTNTKISDFLIIGEDVYEVDGYIGLANVVDSLKRLREFTYIYRSKNLLQKNYAIKTMERGNGRTVIIF